MRGGAQFRNKDEEKKKKRGVSGRAQFGGFRRGGRVKKGDGGKFENSSPGNSSLLLHGRILKVFLVFLFKVSFPLFFSPCGVEN